MGTEIYGLIGRKLGHSYSPAIHSALGNPDYRLYELEPEALGDFLKREDLGGVNVTIPYKLAAMEFWTMGSLSTITAGKLFPNLLVMVIPFVLLLLFHRQAVMLSLGDEHARSMGLNPSLWRGIFLTLSTLMIAGMVSLTGVIAFVGLIAPHIAFKIHKRRDRGFFWLSSAIGGMLMLIADMLCRSLLNGAELPLSVLTVILAVPVLILLLRGKKGGVYGPTA